MYSYQEFKTLVQNSVPRFSSQNQWLNPQQEQAVKAQPHPPTFIVAGPGTGKTTVLVLRTLKLILVDGLRPDGIVLTTFTRKAAKQLRSRVLSWGYAIVNHASQHEQNQQRREWVTNLDINLIRTDTLDSLSEQFLADCRQPGEIVPATVEGFLARSLMREHGLFPNGRFRDEQLNKLLLELGLTFNNRFADKLRGVMTIADRVRHDEIDLTSYATKSPGHRVLCAAIADYLTHLEQNHLADFGQLERLVLELLRQNRLTQVVNQLQALLIDEFQDTNYLQEQIYLQLCRQSGASLTVVGDDDQSIFRFRGATVEIFANFESRLAQTLGQQWQPNRVDLYQNYRSTERIVQFCQYFIDMDVGYQKARVGNKRPLVACALHAQDSGRNIPILGLFRDKVQRLADDLTQFLVDVFRGQGRQIVCNGITYPITRAPDGDFGDSVLLAHKVQETASKGRERLPLLLRRRLQSLDPPVRVFNPRGRSLGDIPEIQQLLGLALTCIDPNGTYLESITTMAQEVRNALKRWIQAAQQVINSDPAPGGLSNFVQCWKQRKPGSGSGMQTWPDEWPLLELIFTLTTWFPIFQRDPEGQVYLEAITRTIAEAGQMSSYGVRIVFDPQHEQHSVREAIRKVFEPIANGEIEVDEEIMPYVPRNYFSIMTIHQAKGLEFPLVIVDVGSDFSRNHPAQRRFRAPKEPDGVHKLEEDVENYCSIGPLRTARPGLDRAWDDLQRLYFVAFSRPENVLLLVGLTSVIRNPNPIPCIACGTVRSDAQLITFVPAEQWSPNSPPHTVALI